MRLPMSNLLALFALLWGASAISTRAETILLSSATVHTVSGPALAPGQVLIKDGKIEAVDRRTRW